MAVRKDSRGCSYAPAGNAIAHRLKRFCPRLLYGFQMNLARWAPRLPWRLIVQFGNGDRGLASADHPARWVAHLCQRWVHDLDNQ